MRTRIITLISVLGLSISGSFGSVTFSSDSVGIDSDSVIVTYGTLTSPILEYDVAAPQWWENFVIIAQASLTLAFLNAASNALNQATDVESDKISKPYRPIPRGVVQADEAQSIAYIFYLFALLR